MLPIFCFSFFKIFYFFARTPQSPHMRCQDTNARNYYNCGNKSFEHSQLKHSSHNSTTFLGCRFFLCVEEIILQLTIMSTTDCEDNLCCHAAQSRTNLRKLIIVLWGYLQINIIFVTVICVKQMQLEQSLMLNLKIFILKILNNTIKTTTQQSKSQVCLT